MSRSRYRPSVSHSWVRRLQRHERRERVDAIAADYDARVAAMHELEWWERRWCPTMRGGYRLRVKRMIRRVRHFAETWSRWQRRTTIMGVLTVTIKVGRFENGRFIEDRHPGVPCHIGCGCA